MCVSDCLIKNKKNIYKSLHYYFIHRLKIIKYMNLSKNLSVDKQLFSGEPSLKINIT